jgi:hypothetical protein
MNREAHTPEEAQHADNSPKDQTNNKPNKPIYKTLEPFKNSFDKILAKLQ